LLDSRVCPRSERTTSVCAYIPLSLLSYSSSGSGSSHILTHIRVSAGPILRIYPDISAYAFSLPAASLSLSLSLSLSFSLLHSVTLLPPAGPRPAYRVSSAASHGHRQTRHGSRSRSGACGFHGETRRSVRWLADNSGERGETGWIRGGFVAIQGTRFQHRQTAVPRTARAASSPCHRRRSTPSPALREQHPGGNARSRARRTICQVSKSEAHISSTATRSRVFPLTRGSQRR